MKKLFRTTRPRELTRDHAAWWLEHLDARARQPSSLELEFATATPRPDERGVPVAALQMDGLFWFFSLERMRPGPLSAIELRAMADSLRQVDADIDRALKPDNGMPSRLHQRLREIRAGVHYDAYAALAVASALAAAAREAPPVDDSDWSVFVSVGALSAKGGAR